MKIDITSLCFGFKIEKENDSGTAAWATSIGQAPKDICYIDTERDGLGEIVYGMMYKSHSDFENLKVRDVAGLEKKEEPRGDRERMMFSVFEDVYVNNKKVEGIYTLSYEREDSTSHKNRLHICYAKYLTYKGHSNKETLKEMAKVLGCNEDACWFVTDISIKNQSSLHFTAIVVNPTKSMTYDDSKARKRAWELLVPEIDNGFHEVQDTEYIRSYLTALRTKPFMLLAGISGTGKSRIVRKLAQATTTQKYDNDEDRWKDNRPENFELIQVKPNWHNSMDVVGFYSNISGKYEFTPFVEFIVKAWQHQDTPYFLCLDEMNLAPVEEYFAEFLSAIESRSTDENDDYITDPIIKPFKNFGEKEGKAMLIQLLGDADPIDKNPIAVHFYEKGLTLPPNLMVMGTVNMDETTFSFSRKVLDRAMSVEMNEVDYDKFLSGESEQFPLLTDMNELLVNRPQRAAEVTGEIESDKVIAYLKDVNTLMEGTPFKLGYRAANEAMLYVAACKKFAGNHYALANALDEFTLMKILSRIEGDDSRLGIADDDPRIAILGIEASEQHTSLLTCLKAIVHKHIGASNETEKKIDQMCNTLEREHFVSYWA